jgi:predicted nucleotidyltransferase component of viral defense system
VRISKEKLLAEAELTGFRAEILEKVIHLLNLLETLNSHPFLKNRLALKGGTALNLFVFPLPRLSVDIDLNYIGTVDRENMLAERPKVEEAITAVCQREGLAIRRIPGDHAGGKWQLRYQSALGLGGNLEIDLNFMFRVPLWRVVKRDSQTIGSYKAKDIPVLDIHELAAGKLAALLARQSRSVRCTPASDQGQLGCKAVALGFYCLRSYESKGLAKDLGQRHQDQVR